MVRCKNCGLKSQVSFMPTTSCGMLLIPGVVAAIVAGFHTFTTIHEKYTAIVGLLAAALAAFAGFIVCMFAIHYVPWTFE